MAILTEKRGPVLHLILDRPEVRNAFDEDAIAAITACFSSLAKSKDRSIRAVVIRGTGKDFCAGADIRWMRRAAGYSPAQNKRDAMRLVGMCKAIDDCPIPVIARVQGACYGGGLGIVAASDIAVAADTSAMAFSECRLGILPAVVSSFVIPKIGIAQARRLFLTAETFPASTAREIALVHDVCPEAELDARIQRFIDAILRTGPTAVREAKTLIRKVSTLRMDKRIRLTVETLARVRSSTEAREGLGAFLEKRNPSWILQATFQDPVTKTAQQ